MNHYLVLPKPAQAVERFRAVEAPIARRLSCDNRCTRSASFLVNAFRQTEHWCSRRPPPCPNLWAASCERKRNARLHCPHGNRLLNAMVAAATEAVEGMIASVFTTTFRWFSLASLLSSSSSTKSYKSSLK
ncbi:hypothetical protein TYRP_021125 [Tyrophagus putrescentiae]|nr:hypothetical protein TYRP_021125 [Tyrophagus putrescentiae]